ncbi:MAG: PadR family transcriptional regulator [Acidimicrobiia bacterium]|nr:PadR family transcriptional regulator [Acidimicrobiia bacterium]
MVMREFEPSLTEYAVLGLLAGGPTHGFAISRTLQPDTEIGRVITVRRPLVYRALDRLVDAGLAEPAHTEPGAAGPNRVIHRLTRAGRRRLDLWLASPVSHVRDMRIEFQLKLALLQRLGRSPLQLVIAQRETLDPTLAALEVSSSDTADHLELWRRHNALAADTYLESLERHYSG